MHVPDLVRSAALRLSSDEFREAFGSYRRSRRC
jgi:hypothetical protein